MRREINGQEIYKRSDADVGQNETMDQLAKANSIRWNGHVLRKDMINCMRRALDLKVNDTIKSG